MVRDTLLVEYMNSSEMRTCLFRLPRSKKLELQISQMNEVGCACILWMVNSSRVENLRLKYEHLMMRVEAVPPGGDGKTPPLPPPRPRPLVLLPLPRPELDGAATSVSEDDVAGLSGSEMVRRR